MDPSISFIENEAIFGDLKFSCFSYNIAPQQISHTENHSLLFHHHAFFEMHLFLKETEIQMLRRTVVIPPNHAIIFTPGTEHRAIPFSSSTTHYVISFQLEKTNADVELFDSIYRKLFDISEGVEPLPVSSQLIVLIDRLIHFQKIVCIHDYCSRQMLVYQIFFELLEKVNQFGGNVPLNISKTRHGTHTSMIMLDELIQMMELSLEDIAGILNYSQGHTNRLIRQTYGKSLREIRNDIKLHSAKKILLEFPDMPLEEVALYSGFASIKAMRLLFLQQEGCTPAKFRKTYTK